MKTWDDIERAARGEPWTEQTKYIISGEPILWQACKAVQYGTVSREDALIQVVFALLEIKNVQQKTIIDYLNTRPFTPFIEPVPPTEAA